MSDISADCIDIELRVGRCMYAGSSKPISETASVRQALWVNHTEIRCLVLQMHARGWRTSQNAVNAKLAESPFHEVG